MKIPKSDKRILGTIGSVTYLTGVTLFVLDHWIRIRTTIGEQHHPLEHWMRVAHASVTYGVMLSLGYLFKGHILPGLRAQKKRKLGSGIATLVTFFFLPITALFVMYGGESETSHLLAKAHAIVGLGTPVFLLFHVAKFVPFRSLYSSFNRGLVLSHD